MKSQRNESIQVRSRSALRTVGWRHAALPCSNLFAHSAASAAPDSDASPTVTPYRPSVSTPATLTAPGWLEVQAGASRARDRDGAARVDSVPYTLKLAFTPDWGVRVGGNALVRSRDAEGARATCFGDTAVVLKRRFEVSDASAFGLEAGVNFPTAKEGLGSGGKRDYNLNTIYSTDFADKYHLDANLNFTRLGAVEPGARHLRIGWAAAVSRSLDDRWGVTGELSGTQQRGADRTAQALLATSYNVSKAVALDAGFNRGLTSASTKWSVFAGITFLTAKLF